MPTRMESFSQDVSQATQRRSSSINRDSGCILCDKRLNWEQCNEPILENAKPPVLTIRQASDLLYDSIEEHQTRLLDLEPGPFVSPLRARMQTGYIVLYQGIAIHGWKYRAHFTALSYTWGAPDFLHTIVINDVQMPIASNLYAFLQRYRASGDSQPLWIDALCINQSNLTEKSMQVKNMMRIYERADTVLVWLGDQGKSTSFAMRALETKSILPSRSAKWCSICLDALVDGIEDIGNRDWARRIWIRQEVCAAQQLIVWCGSCQLAWRTYKELDSVAARELGPHHRHVNLRPEQQACLRTLGERILWRDFLYDLWIKDAPDEPSFASQANISAGEDIPGLLSYLLLQSKRCQSTLDVDRIYALVGIAEVLAQSGPKFYQQPSSTFDIDYNKTVEQVFTDFAWLIVNTIGYIWILDRIASVPNDLGLPSWVPDYRHPPSPPHQELLWYWYEYGLGNKQIHREEASVLILTGIHLATVTDEAPLASDSDSETQITRRIRLVTSLSRRLQMESFPNPKLLRQLENFNLMPYWRHRGRQAQLAEEAILPVHSQFGGRIICLNAELSIVIRQDLEAPDRSQFIGRVKFAHDSTIKQLMAPERGNRHQHDRYAKYWGSLPERFLIA